MTQVRHQSQDNTPEDPAALPDINEDIMAALREQDAELEKARIELAKAKTEIEKLRNKAKAPPRIYSKEEAAVPPEEVPFRDFRERLSRDYCKPQHAIGGKDGIDPRSLDMMVFPWADLPVYNPYSDKPVTPQDIAYVPVILNPRASKGREYTNAQGQKTFSWELGRTSVRESLATALVYTEQGPRLVSLRAFASVSISYIPPDEVAENIERRDLSDSYLSSLRGVDPVDLSEVWGRDSRYRLLQPAEPDPTDPRSICFTPSDAFNQRRPHRESNPNPSR